MRRETPGTLEAAFDRHDQSGCAFVLDGADADPARARFCDMPPQPGSAYCPHHHSRCRLPGGSTAERQELREIEALARAVGGTQGRAARRPPPGLLRRLDSAVRAAACLNRSRIVRDVTDDDATTP